MIEGQTPPEQGYSIHVIESLIRGQIDQKFDAFRMRERWPIILSKADPETVAKALVNVLSGGHYVPRKIPVRPVVNIHIDGDVDRKAVLEALLKGVTINPVDR